MCSPKLPNLFPRSDLIFDELEKGAVKAELKTIRQFQTTRRSY